MSSINEFPTFQYSQPEDYHFSHDSVFLARRVYEIITNQVENPQNVLDLCAGCGVIGLDLLFHLRAGKQTLPKNFDFLEVQKEYENHFHENLNRLGNIDTRCRFINDNYAMLLGGSLDEKYDLIVCNPPYFSKNQGKLPVSDLKLRSRFFIDSNLESLIQFIGRSLAPAGKAYVLIRDQLEHKQDQLSIVRDVTAGILNMQQLEDIRGTHLIRLSLVLS